MLWYSSWCSVEIIDESPSHMPALCRRLPACSSARATGAKLRSPGCCPRSDWRKYAAGYPRTALPLRSSRIPSRRLSQRAAGLTIVPLELGRASAAACQLSCTCTCSSSLRSAGSFSADQSGAIKPSSRSGASPSSIWRASGADGLTFTDAQSRELCASKAAANVVV